MQKLKKGIASYKHVKLSNLENSDIKHKIFLARKFYKKSKNLYPIDHKKSIFTFNSTLFAQKIPLKHKYLIEYTKSLPEHNFGGVLLAKTKFIQKRSLKQKLRFCKVRTKAELIRTKTKFLYKLRFCISRAYTKTSFRQKLHFCTQTPFVKTLFFCQNKAPVSVLYASSRQYITKKNKQRAIIVLQNQVKQKLRFCTDAKFLTDARKTKLNKNFVFVCIDRPFYQLAHTQKLEILYPTNLDKMSFLFTDLANLALSLNTYTFLKKNNIHKVGNLLEYSPKNLYLFLNKNREMFLELKICFLLLGFWQKDLLE